MNLKQKRIKCRKSQHDIARETGLSVAYICNLENGKRTNPSMKTMKIIAKSLNTTVQDLFFSDNN